MCALYNEEKKLYLDIICPKEVLSLGSLLKRLREERKLTLREVSKELDVDISMLGKIEKNSRTPTDKFIERASVFFNIGDEELKIAYLSDVIVNQIIEEEKLSDRILDIVQQKLDYLKKK